MKTDCELMELAAKAAGLRHVCYDGLNYDGKLGLQLVDEIGRHTDTWNPLSDDGDALRLAVTLGICPGRCMQIVIDGEISRTGVRHTGRGGKYDELEEHGADPYAATRRAIVRAAAEIGASA